MSSQRQIEANRRNSQKSTGPTSVTGKAVSSMNALKTGLHAESLVLPSENAADLEELTQEYYQHHRPASPDARALVDDLIRCEWTLRRLDATETEMWQYQAERSYGEPEKYPLGKPATAYPNTFSRLQYASTPPAAPANAPFRPRKTQIRTAGPRTAVSTSFTPNHFPPNWLRSANPHRRPAPTHSHTLPHRNFPARLRYNWI